MATKRASPAPPGTKDFAAIASGYEQDVVSGRILACKETIQACQRNIDDLARRATAERPWPFVYSPDAGSKVCRFLSKLKHVEGALAGQYFDIHPAHVWFVMSAYSWLKTDTGKRRFSRLHWEGARGNAKSFLSSGLALYHLCADNEQGGQVYSAATTLKQAKTVWSISKVMAQRAKDLRAFYGVNVWAHTLTVPKTASKFEAICSKAESLDSLNISFVVVDELHAHKNRDLYDVLVTALGKREQSLMLCITTAGTIRVGIATELRSYLQQVLSGEHEDESLLGIIYTLDAADDWRDPAVLPKANPLWGFSVIPSKLLEAQQVAIASPASASNFKVKHCNVYTSAGTAFFNVDKLKEHAAPHQKLEDFLGERCWIGIDLASKRDLASTTLTFKRGAVRHQFTRNYVNQQAIDEGSNKNYEFWAKEGYLTVNPGPVTDHQQIEADILEDVSRFDVAEVGIDPHNAGLMSQRLATHTEVVEMRQTVVGLSEPTKAMDAAIRAGLLVHDGSPVTEWCFGNVMCNEDKKQQVFPYKAQPGNKIDAAISSILSLARANAEDDNDDEAFDTFIGLKKPTTGK